MMSLYQKIKKHREEMELSQDQLATLVGYKNRSSIARIERGDVRVPQHKVEKFAKIFGVAAGDLMGWDSQDSENFSREEKAIIYKFRNLNSKGRKKIRILLDDYSMIANYQKADISPAEDCD